MSQIWQAYEKAMADKIVKTAEKKGDEDYNIVPPSAGPDTKVDETGYELTEIAHPEQVQVALSQLNDGIVENGVEQQKAMIDVALRNPRGVIAEVIQTLVKVANELDEAGDYKMAAEVDGMIEKIGQELPGPAQDQLQYSGSGRVPSFAGGDIYKAFEDAADGLDSLNLSGGIETRIKSVIDGLKRLSQLQNQADPNQPDQLIQWTMLGINFVKAQKATVDMALKTSRSSFFHPLGGIVAEAEYKWNNLIVAANEWLNANRDAVEKVKAQQADEYKKQHPETQPVSSTTPAPATQGDKGDMRRDRPGATPLPARREVAKDAPMSSGGGKHGYSVKDPLVGELQQLLRQDGHDIAVDNKFGHDTHMAIVDSSQNNSDLASMLHYNPRLAQGWQGWDAAHVEEAINAIKRYRGGQAQQQAQQAPAPQQDWLGPQDRMDYGQPKTPALPKVVPPAPLYTKQE